MVAREKLDVAIVGAGIGGLTTAIALRADGHEVTCFDRTAMLREVGAGLQLDPNVSRLLLRLGLGPKLDPVVVLPVATRLRRWKNGEILLERAQAPAERTKRYGAPWWAIHRADLHSALLSSVPRQSVRLGVRCASAENRGDRAVLKLADGSEHAADVVIGADGIHSAIRELFSKDKKVFAGKHTFRALIPAKRVPELASPPRLNLWVGPSRSAVTYPVSGGSLVNVAGVYPADESFDESWTTERRIEDVRAAFADWDQEFRALLAAADTALVLPLYDRDPITKWGEGRITLLGDAAHPMLPYRAQGAAQAIEDAIVLARSLRTITRAEVDVALRRYEAERMERTAEIQRESRDETMHLPDGEEQEKRDAFLKMLASRDEREDPVQMFDAEIGKDWREAAAAS